MLLPGIIAVLVGLALGAYPLCPPLALLVLLVVAAVVVTALEQRGGKPPAKEGSESAVRTRGQGFGVRHAYRLRALWSVVDACVEAFVSGSRLAPVLYSTHLPDPTSKPSR